MCLASGEGEGRAEGLGPQVDVSREGDPVEGGCELPDGPGEVGELDADHHATCLQGRQT